MLKRAVLSTLAFAAATENQAIKTYIITDKESGSYLKEFSNKINIITVSGLDNIDTRNVLIREAVRSVSEDFILFLDDDDWVFPNEAQFVSQLLTCLPKEATLVVDSQTFSEKIEHSGETDWRNSSLRRQTKFASVEWHLNFSGHNHIPVCGAFYSRRILSEQPVETFDTVTYFEDFGVSIYALLNPNSTFFNTPKTIAGISIREVGNDIENTVNASDRTKWSRSQAELAYHLCSDPNNNVAFAIGRAFAISEAGQHAGHCYGQAALQLSRLDRKALALSRTIRGFIKFSVQPNLYKENCQHYWLALRQRGVQGAIRAIADTRG